MEGAESCSASQKELIDEICDSLEGIFTKAIDVRTNREERNDKQKKPTARKRIFKKFCESQLKTVVETALRQ